MIIKKCVQKKNNHNHKTRAETAVDGEREPRAKKRKNERKESGAGGSIHVQMVHIFVHMYGDNVNNMLITWFVRSSNKKRVRFKEYSRTWY